MTLKNTKLPGKCVHFHEISSKSHRQENMHWHLGDKGEGGRLSWFIFVVYKQNEVNYIMRCMKCRLRKNTCGKHFNVLYVLLNCCVQKSLINEENYFLQNFVSLHNMHFKVKRLLYQSKIFEKIIERIFKKFIINK